MLKNKKIFLSLIVSIFVLSFFVFKHFFSVFYFQNDLNRLSFNIETSQKQEVLACFDNNCDNMTFKNDVYSYKLNQQNPLFYKNYSNIELVFNKYPKFNNITFFDGNKFKYFKQNDVIINKIDFNDNVKYSINLPFKTNSKSAFKQFAVYFETIFYNWYFYLFFYVALIFYLIKFPFSDKFKIKHPIFLIILLGTFLRLSHINYVPLWNDELYTLCVISENGKNVFQNLYFDPGNPPLFFFLSNLWLKFFNSNIILIRLLPAIIGILGIYSTYFFTKKVLNNKTALFTSFLYSINIFIILESNEIRSYILSMALILACSYLFYRLYQNFNSKNLIYYFLIATLLSNCHYYCVLYVLSNMILGGFIFKNLKEKLKFLILNIFSLLTFLIYFILTYQNSLSEKFNTWLVQPNLEVILNHISFYFGNIIFFIISIGFLVFMLKKLEKKEKQIVSYMTYSIAFVFLSAFVISFIVKPILFERYFCIFLPFLIIITSIFLTYNYKTKFKPLIIIAILLFSVNAPKYENFNLFSNIEYLAKYIKNDYKNYSTDYDIYYLIPDNIKYLNYYNLPKDKAIVTNCPINESYELILDIIKYSNKKKIVIYFSETFINKDIINNLHPKKIETTILPIYKISVVK